jgi:hypothetical protein
LARALAGVRQLGCAVCGFGRGSAKPRVILDPLPWRPRRRKSYWTL